MATLLKTRPGQYNTDVAELFNLLGEDFRDKGDFDKAIGYYNKALNLYKNETTCSELIIAKIYNNLSDSYCSKELFDDALAYC